MRFVLHENLRLDDGWAHVGSWILYQGKGSKETFSGLTVQRLSHLDGPQRRYHDGGACSSDRLHCWLSLETRLLKLPVFTNLHRGQRLGEYSFLRSFGCSESR